ncbi:MAG: GntR family transcriptional regulator [Kiritimatiellae bacterium]|nr:GntR family transcriptional regulator [Kiritimatiellia bacterium]
MKTAQTKYGRVIETLRAQIREGVYKPGSRLPGQLALTKEFGVSVITVNRALNELAKEGLLRRRERSGTYVAERVRPLSSLVIVFDSTPKGMLRVAEYLGGIRERAESLDIPTELYKPTDPVLQERLRAPDPGLGVIVLEIEWPDVVNALLAASVPVVVAATQPRYGRYCVMGDRRRAGLELTRVLLAEGCKRVGFLHNQGTIVHRLSCQGYRDAIRELKDDTPFLIRSAYNNTDSVAEVVRSFLAEEKDLDGLVVIGGIFPFAVLPPLLERKPRPRLALLAESPASYQLKDHAFIAHFDKAEVGRMAVDLLCEVAAGRTPWSVTWHPPLQILRPGESPGGDADTDAPAEA